MPAGLMIGVGAMVAVGAYVAWFNWAGGGSRTVDVHVRWLRVVEAETYD
jgi:hypothetical protein